MIRWSKVRAVATFEFVGTVRRKGYLIATFGMPVFLLLYIGLVSIPGIIAAKKEAETKVYGVIDRSGVLGMAGDVEARAVELPPEVVGALRASGREDAVDRALAWQGNAVFRPYPDLDAALEDLRDKRIEGVFVLPGDYLAAGEIDDYVREGWDTGASGARQALRNVLLDRLLAGRIPADVADRVRKPIARSESFSVAPGGEVRPRSKLGEAARIILPIIFVLLLFVSIMMSAGYLLQATAAEKENKVVEVLLSSADPDEILAGKLAGLGGAGLLQVTVWFGMALAAGGAFAGALAAIGVDVPWAALVAAVVFFPATYLFLGSLMLGTGSLGGNLRESQQMSMVWSLLAAVPMIFLGLLMQEPNGTIGRVLTWIPFSAPVTVVLRLSLEPAGVAWWEVAGSFAVLLVSIWVALRLGARLFRVGMLLTGARPKLREILRQAKLTG